MTLAVVSVDTKTGAVNRWVRGDDGILVCSHQAQYPEWDRVLAGDACADARAIEKLRLTDTI